MEALRRSPAGRARPMTPRRASLVNRPMPTPNP